MKSADPVALFQRYHDKGLLLDANLLLLFFAGCTGPEAIRSHPRLSDYTSDDFTLIAQIFHHFSKRGGVVTTPHILAEVSNLSERLRDGHQLAFFLAMRQQVQILAEQTVEAKTLTQLEAFPRFGLTDMAIAFLADRRFLVLTADRPFFGHLQKLKITAIHFKDLRHVCLGL